MALDACAVTGACKAHSALLPSPPFSTVTVCRVCSDLEIHPSTTLKATGKGGFEMRPVCPAHVLSPKYIIAWRILLSMLIKSIC